jgi:hypothetical protein
MARRLPRAFLLGLAGWDSSSLCSCGCTGAVGLRVGLDKLVRFIGSGKGLGPLALDKGDAALAGEVDIFG